ncbi:hypothetical protein L7F22_027920 [Adiantum nelumboides]|nr:hypothetical protein [Adiantum nelumboides]
MAQRRLIVEVCAAHNLMPKDDERSSSTYVQVEFDGQCRRARTKPKDLNPVWDEPLDFWVTNPSELGLECLEATVYHDRGARKPTFLGCVCVPGSSIVPRGQEALISYPLERKGLFSHIKGELGLKVFSLIKSLLPEAPPPPQPDAPPPPETPPTEAPPKSLPNSIIINQKKRRHH